jgi:hypothetical protein
VSVCGIGNVATNNGNADGGHGAVGGSGCGAVGIGGGGGYGGSGGNACAHTGCGGESNSSAGSSYVPLRCLRLRTVLPQPLLA